MTAVVVIHAVTALLFAIIASWQRRGAGATWPRHRLVAALALTALWALAVAGVGNEEAVTRVLLSARDMAWLYLLLGIAAQARGTAGLARSRLFAFGVVAACALVPGVLAIGGEVLGGKGSTALGAIRATALAMRMLFAAAAAVLAYRQLATDAQSHDGRRVLVAVLALWWSTDLANTSVAYFLGEWSVPLLLVRGLTVTLLAPVIAIAVQRGGAWQLSVSQAVAVRTVGFGAAAIYAAGTAALAGLLGGALGSGAGSDPRMIQTAIVVGAATSLLTLASTPWLRAWLRVVVAKHLFAHRYDYRAAWTGFGETLARPQGDGATLGCRVLEALAQLTDAPAALLLTREGERLLPGAKWRWTMATGDADARLVAHLEGTRRIVDLGAVRAGQAPAAEIAAIPAWLAGPAASWAAVPLLHFNRLVGVAVLAAPPLARPLDWEDFDLLAVAGRQAATLLAEEGAAAALAEARRFEEFNRRFAFIMHDLKNLVSQTALVARNAERHGDDPAFRADMVATLRDTSQRMSTLIARLDGRTAPVAETVQPTAPLALARRIAAARRGAHTITVAGEELLVAANPAALEAALAHLVQNAVDASPADAAVVIAVAPGGDDDATITVTDRGTGMTAAFVRDELFRPFASAKPGGFGLGAFDARQLIAGMGGTLSVETREGRGTCFTIRLPLAPALEAAA